MIFRIAFVLMMICTSALAQKSYIVSIYHLYEDTTFSRWYKAGPSNSFANDIIADSAGNTYFTNTAGVYRLSASTGELKEIISGGGFSGDGGLADTGHVNYPAGLCLDQSGNLLIADLGNNRIRRINLNSGIVTTIAGNGTYACTGDYGPATEAGIGTPVAICAGKDGSIYFADNANGRVRVIKGGIVLPVCSVSASGISDIALSNDERTIYIADRKNNCILFSDIGVTGPVLFAGGAASSDFHEGDLALNSFIEAPSGLWVDETGNVLFTDNSSTVRKINMTTERIYTVAGKYQIPGFWGEGGLADTSRIGWLTAVTGIPGSQDLLIADVGNGRIRRIYKSAIEPPVALGAMTLCRYDSLSGITFHATGTNLKWYKTPYGGTSLSEAPHINYRDIGIRTYFVSQTIGGVESARHAITAEIRTLNRIITDPSPLELCMDNRIQDLIIKSYPYWSSNTTSIYFSTNKSFSDTLWYNAQIPLGYHNIFWVANDISGCTWGPDSAYVYVHAPLPPPQIDSLIGVCHGSKPDTLKAEGLNIEWLGYNSAPAPPTFPEGRISRYKLLQHDSIGCPGDTGYVNVIVRPIPSTPGIGKYVYCQFDAATELSPKGDSVLWFDSTLAFLTRNTLVPSTSVAGNFPFRVKRINDYGCTSLSFGTVNVLVNKTPDLVVSHTPESPAVGMPVTIKAETDGNIIWKNCSGSDTCTFIPSYGGTYAYRVISVSQEGCSDTFNGNLTVRSSDYWNTSLKAYPNPFKKKITISGIDGIDILGFRLIDLNGRIIYTSKFSKTEFTYELPDDIPVGDYILELNTVGTANPSALLRKEE